MKTTLIIILILIGSIAYAAKPVPDSAITPNTSAIYVPGADSLRYPTWIAITPYNIVGDTAVYCTLWGFFSNTTDYIDFNYYLVSARGNVLYRGTLRADSFMFKYLQLTCLLPTCRIPYVYWLLINRNKLNITQLSN